MASFQIRGGDRGGFPRQIRRVIVVGDSARYEPPRFGRAQVFLRAREGWSYWHSLLPGSDPQRTRCRKLIPEFFDVRARRYLNGSEVCGACEREQAKALAEVVPTPAPPRPDYLVPGRDGFFHELGETIDGVAFTRCARVVDAVDVHARRSIAPRDVCQRCRPGR